MGVEVREGGGAGQAEGEEGMGGGKRGGGRREKRGREEGERKKGEVGKRGKFWARGAHAAPHIPLKRRTSSIQPTTMVRLRMGVILHSAQFMNGNEFLDSSRTSVPKIMTSDPPIDTPCLGAHALTVCCSMMQQVLNSSQL